MKSFSRKRNLIYFLLILISVSFLSCGGGSTSSSSASGPVTPSSVPIAIEGIDGVSGVDTSSSFQVTFPENVRPDTVNSDTFFIVEYDGTSPNLSKFVKATYDPSNIDTSNKIAADISCDGKVCTLTPRTPLSHGKTYIVVVTTAVQFTSGGYYDGYMATFATTITIGGTVAGLTGTGLVLTNTWSGSSEDLTISADGSFTFTTYFDKDIAYVVTVKTQPATSDQICTVNNSQGTTGTENITITVTCRTNTYTIAGEIRHLTGNGLVLQNNGGDDLTISTDGAFTFATSLAKGTAYAVTVNTSAHGGNCVVEQGSGTISTNVTNVVVTCIPIIYMADALNNRIIKMNDMSGTGWASYGDNPGDNTFSAPTGIDLNSNNGHIYVADNGNHKIVEMDDFSGTGLTTLGTSGGGIKQFFNPSDVAIGSNGEIYIDDNGNSRIVKMDNINGDGWTTFGSVGGGDNHFQAPWGIAIGGSDKIYVADTGNNRIVGIDDMNGTNWITLGSTGGGVNQFSDPFDIAYDKNTGAIYVADRGNNRIVKINNMSGAGWTSYGDNPGDNTFNAPRGIAIGSDGKIYVADTGNNRTIRMDDITGAGWSATGTGGSGVMQFNLPHFITVP